MSATARCHTEMLLSELRWVEGVNILLTHTSGAGQRSFPSVVGLSCILVAISAGHFSIWVLGESWCG